MKKTDMARGVFFQNYDYSGDDPNGPGTGLYNGDMSKYKSVGDFLKKKKKRLKRITLRRQAIVNVIYLESFGKDEPIDNLSEDDENDIDFDTDGTATQIPFAPAEVSQIGFYDGTDAREELENPIYKTPYGGLIGNQ
jgi:hypothetical protein